MQQMLILLIAVPVELLLEKGKRALSLFLRPPMCHVLIFQQKIESDQSSGWIGVCLQ